MNSPIYIMWLRQLKRTWRSKTRLIASLVQPLLFLVALGFGLGPVFQKAGGGNYIDFLSPGIIAMTILFSSMFAGMEVLWDKEFGFLKETLVAPVSRWKIMLGRTLGGATVSSLQGVLVLILAMIVGFRPSNVLLVIASFFFMFLLALLFTSFGTAIASKLNDMQSFPIIINFIIMPLFFLSGALFPVNNLPGALADVIKINPLSYGVDALRHTLTGAGSFSLFLDFAILFILTIVVLFIGSRMFKNMEI
jgi:ABC-2 type transport system permease protein